MLNAWGSSWGPVMSKVRAYDLEVEAKPRGTMLTSATGCLTGKKIIGSFQKKNGRCILFEHLGVHGGF